MVKHNEYLELKEANLERAQKTASQLGHPPFDNASMIGARLELLIDHLLGADEPVNQKRTRFENDYQLQYSEALDQLEAAMREQKLRPTNGRRKPPGLYVPGSGK